MSSALNKIIDNIDFSMYTSGSVSYEDYKQTNSIINKNSSNLLSHLLNHYSAESKTFKLHDLRFSTKEINVDSLKEDIANIVTSNTNLLYTMYLMSSNNEVINNIDTAIITSCTINDANALVMKFDLSTTKLLEAIKKYGNS